LEELKNGPKINRPLDQGFLGKPFGPYNKN
jgi:hypothetical protein